MRGLRKYLTPFAPDQSGAASVLYELGGILVICDAGGCTGNICGFDEPRWHSRRSAVFSAGLRDMDAILGRDDKLVSELLDAAEHIDASFAAIIGTPVPSVIGTDYRALRRMTEIAVEKYPVVPGRTGVLGVNPLDMSDLRAAERIREKLPGALCYGMDGSLEDIRRASEAEKNIVCAPSGLRAAKYLREKFGTPYEVVNPLAELPADRAFTGKRVLIVHQQVTANSLRALLLEQGAAEVTCATWFMQKKELARPGDVRLTEEDDFQELVESGSYDILMGDPTLWRIVPRFPGELADMPQFPVSGRLEGCGADE